MSHHRSLARSLLSLIALFVLVSLACNLPSPGDEARPAPETEAAAQETESTEAEPQEPAPAEPVLAEPVEAEPAAAESVEAQEPTPAAPVVTEQGFSLTNPFPPGVQVETPYWDFQVLKVIRGEPAYQRILEDKPDAEAPPPGMEYVVFHMHLRNKFTDEYSHSVGLSDVYIIGGGRLARTDDLTDVPAPELVYTDTFSAEELEGWYDALVPIDEDNLILVWNPSDGTDEPARYMTLEEGATIAAPAGLADIAPNELGIDPQNPARFGSTVVTEDWELTVLEVLHGDEAAAVFRQLHEANEVDEGMEPTLVKMRLRYLSEQDELQWVSLDNFAAAQDAERVTEGPRYLIWNPYDPPWMQINFLSGGEHEGWMILQSPAGESGVMLRFKPDAFDALRYLSLEP